MLGLFVAGARAGEPEVVSLLDRTVWVDIGIGRNLASLSAKEVTELKACRTATMAFRKTDAGWEQIFYTGIETRTVYAFARLVKNGAEITIRFFTQGRLAPVETVRLLPRQNALVEETPGFRPHTFLQCNFSRPDAKGHGN